MFDYKISTFTAIYEEGTLLKAAEKIGLTQSAVSQHLKALEEELNLKLFRKEGRKLVVTDVGLDFYRSITTCNSIFKEFKRVSNNIINSKKSFIIGATLTIGEFILPYYLGEFKKIYPGIDISLKIENTENTLKSLDMGDIDLALIEGPFNKRRYSHELFIKDEMVFIEKFNNSDLNIITPKDIEQRGLILREKGSGTRYYWEKYCYLNGVDIYNTNIIMEVSSLTAIKALVEIGIGSSVMSSKAIEKEIKLKSIRSIPFSTGPLLRELFFVYNKNTPLDLIARIKSLV